MASERDGWIAAEQITDATDQWEGRPISRCYHIRLSSHSRSSPPRWKRNRLLLSFAAVKQSLVFQTKASLASLLSVPLNVGRRKICSSLFVSSGIGEVEITLHPERRLSSSFERKSRACVGIFKFNCIVIYITRCNVAHGIWKGYVYTIWLKSEKEKKYDVALQQHVRASQSKWSQNTQKKST